MPGRADRFRVTSLEPAYLALYRDGRLRARAEQARGALESCRLCPRACDARRLDGGTGTCGVGRWTIVSSAFPQLGEEDCLRGKRGSGTIFFAGCSLRCAFCQNAEVSWRRSGTQLEPADLAAAMLSMQEHGCHNLNLVTPTHVVPQLIESLALAAEQGLRLPVVYNSSGYDRVETLALLDGIVDVYLPDFKFWRPETATRYAAAGDYPEVARRALVEMQRQVGLLCFSADGLARRGVLVRHLVMPGLAAESGAILEWLAREVSPDTYVNVMTQYRPAWQVGQRDGAGWRFAEIDRVPYAAEIEAVYEAGREAGLWRFDQHRGH
jgi:putative pyruvate formate lyase activating enzyme